MKPSKTPLVACSVCGAASPMGPGGLPLGWAHLWTPKGLEPMCGPCQRDPFGAMPSTSAHDREMEEIFEREAAARGLT